MEYLCVIEYFFDESPGGSGRVAWDIAKAMRDQGHSVTVFFYQKNGVDEGITDYEGVRLIRFKKEEKPGWHPGRMNAIINSAKQASYKYLKDRSWDIVHIHTPLIGLGVIRALGSQPEYIVTVHSPIVPENEIIWRAQGITGKLKLLFGRKLLSNIEGEVLKTAKKIHTLSNYTRKIIDEMYGVGGKVTVIPHWYEPGELSVDKNIARHRLGWPEQANIFFTVRGMRPRYGLEVAIRALAPIVKGDNKSNYFFIGGSGPLRQSLENLASALGVSDKIKFLGRLSDEDLELAYIAADIFVLPTLALECYGLITVEALSYGCPVISSDAGAIPEIMRPVLPDCIVPAGSEDALRNKIEEYLSGRLSIPECRALVGYTRTRYSKNAILPAFNKLFEK